METDPPEPRVLDYGRSEPRVKWVRVGGYANLIDANLVVNALQTHGIHAVLGGENVAAALGPVYGAAYGRLEVMVSEIDFDAARAILADIDRVQKERRDRELPPCPACQTRDVKRVLASSRWIGIALLVAGVLLLSFDGPFEPAPALAAFLVGIYLLVRSEIPKWRCRSCHQAFRAPVPEVPEEPDEDDNPPAT